MTTPPQNQTELEKAIGEATIWKDTGFYSPEGYCGLTIYALLDAAERLKEAEKENETLHKQLDKGYQILFECGYCECGGQIVHHIDEPFFNCDTCNRRGESTTVPLIQRFTIKTRENERQLTTLRTEYKKTLEVLTDTFPNLICSFTATQNLPACDSFDITEELWCSVCKRRKTINKVLTTPSAIAVMKGDKV